MNKNEYFKRNSIRGYLNKEIPEDVLNRVVEAACEAPSWANTQPVKIHVITGQKKENLSKRMVEAGRNGVPKTPDLPMPSEWPEDMLLRMKEHAKERSEFANIARDDKEKRFEFQLKMYRFLDAPVALIFTIDDSLSEWSLLDVGSAMQNIIVAANMEGLGTCPQASAVYYPEIIRKELNLDGSNKIIVGMAIGYPDSNAQINNYQAKRRAFDEMIYWHQ